METAIIEDRAIRNEQKMFRKGRLWFIDDGAMYVYYTPTHWREPSKV